jgi:DNA invertase Pin-like site-specific DNA recombinase
MVVRHKCDRPICCNPAHLEIGTPADNVRDREKRGRGRAPGRRLTLEQVETIRARHSAGEHYATIAADFGVALDHVYRIATRRAWKDVA